MNSRTDEEEQKYEGNTDCNQKSWIQSKNSTFNENSIFDQGMLRNEDSLQLRCKDISRNNEEAIYTQVTVWKEIWKKVEENYRDYEKPP